MYDIQITEDQRSLLLALVRLELQNPNTQDSEEIEELQELEDLLG